VNKRQFLRGALALTLLGCGSSNAQPMPNLTAVDSAALEVCGSHQVIVKTDAIAENKGQAFYLPAVKKFLGSRLRPLISLLWHCVHA